MDRSRHLAWRDQRLVFRDAGLDEVCRALDATFTTESTGEILNVMAAALQLRYGRDGRRVR